jgi:hypothetical protein
MATQPMTMSTWTAWIEWRDALGNVVTTGHITGECEYVWTNVCNNAAGMQEGESMCIDVAREPSQEQANRAAMDAMMGYAGTRETKDGQPLAGVDPAWERT